MRASSSWQPLVILQPGGVQREGQQGVDIFVQNEHIFRMCSKATNKTLCSALKLDLGLLMLFLQFLQSRVACLWKDAHCLRFSKSVPPAAPQLQPCFWLSEVKNKILAKCWISHSLSSLRIISLFNCGFKVLQDQFKSQ